MTRRDLLRLGFGESSIEHRIRTGRLHRVRRGVYAVGWPVLTIERRWMAAVLVCGKSAVLSHRSAAALWGLAGDGGGLIEVTAPARVERPGTRAHERRLPLADLTRHRGIPTTGVVRTLLDFASVSSGAKTERAVNEADKLGLIDPETLRGRLDELAGQRGVRPLRVLLDRGTFRLSDSELERRFRPIIAAAGLTPPATKQTVNGFEVDFYWPTLGLVVETDGLRYHRTPASQARDRRRDQAHTAAGLVQLRFTHWQVAREPAYVREVLIKTLRNR